MQTVVSRNSNLSQHTQKVIEEVASKSVAKIYSLEGVFTDEQIRIVWNALGLYLSKNLRIGRGISIPKFGIFTFTPPEVRLPGVTNPEDRDLKPRLPVFVVSKDFVRGKDLRPAIYFHQEFGAGLRPYTVYGSNGQIPVVKINLTEVASYANMTKDSTEVALNRTIKHLSEKVLSSGNCVMQIPSIGTLLVRNNLVGVKYNQFIQRDTRNVVSQSLQKRKKRGQLELTKDNLKKFAALTNNSIQLSKRSNQFLQIDENTKGYLQSTYGFHFNDNNRRRTIVNFDRTVASKQFNNTSNTLRDSHLSRVRGMSGSRFSSVDPTNSIKYDYNMALKLIKQWIITNKYNTENSYIQFMNISKSKRDKKGILTESDFWSGCKNISIDITEQQSHELFRLLDTNKDGVISFDDWNQVIRFDTNNIVRKVTQYIKQNHLTRNDVINRLGLANIPSFDVFKLQNSLIKLCNILTEDEAFNLSRYISKGENQTTLQNVLYVFQIVDQNSSKIKVDKNWQIKFLERVKLRMMQTGIYQEELQAKFEFYNKNQNGFITQSNFKDVLNDVGIIITLSQLIKLVKTLPVNEKNEIKFIQFINKLKDIEIQGKTYNEISSNDFFKIVSQKILKKTPFPYKLPLSLESFASLIQVQHFPEQSEQILRKYLVQLDVDKNGQITKEDIQAFKRQQYSQSLSDSVVHVKEETLKDIVKQIREKLIKKRMSYYDLYHLLDSNKDGFITMEQWDNITKIIHLQPYLQQALFRYIDRENLSLFDYKTFLSVIQDTRKPFLDQKYDWVNEVLNKIKQWYNKSNLLPEDAFKVLDKNVDGYISEEQFINFLQSHMKYQRKELTHVRIQKLIKLFDTYKRGKIDLVDFKKVILQSDNNWFENAKQQIGIAISRKYQSLQDAFNEISGDEKNILCDHFEKWIQKNKMTSGFMLNEKLVKQLFAHLDPHKKGCLTESDFANAFGKYNWKTSNSLELIQTLKQKFKTIKDAYKHLTGYKTGSLNRNQFEASIKEIFGNRFTLTDIEQLWKNISTGQNTINFEKFTKFIGNQWDIKDALNNDYPRDNWVYQDFDIIKGTVNRQSNQHTFYEKDDIQTQCRKIVDSVKDILRTSPKTLEQAFKQADKDNRGVVTNLQFKHAFRILNIALTSKQIDLLLNFCDFGIVNLIDWKQFIKRFNLVGQKKKIIERSHPKMKYFSDLLHYHMISPKDAYRKWNDPSTGYMSFEQFYTMVKELFRLAHTETLPQYTVIRELFDYLDIRKDGKLDYQEWVQAFRNYNPPSILMGTITPTKEKSNLIQTQFLPLMGTVIPNREKPKQNQLPVRLQSLPLFEQSQQYEEFTKLVGRNRKYILQKLEAIQSKSPLIQYQSVEKIIKDIADQQKISFEKQIYRGFLAFALTGEKIDYKLLLQAFKTRLQKISQFPKKKIF